MNAVYDAMLDDLIAEVLDRGAATVEVRNLVRWHRRKNWGKVILEDLQRRFDKLLTERGEQDEGWVLYSINGAHVVSLLCFSSDDDSWWRPVKVRIAEYV